MNLKLEQKIDKLYDQLLSSLYERQDRARARTVANRLAKVLSKFNPEPESIFIEECRSLVSEAQGDLEKSIWHRENEIRLIRRLFQLAQENGTADIVHSEYDYSDLHDRLNTLAMLYHDNGDVHRAIRTLEESKNLCADQGIAFDAEDLLRRYLEERVAGPSRNE